MMTDVDYPFKTQHTSVPHANTNSSILHYVTAHSNMSSSHALNRSYFSHHFSNYFHRVLPPEHWDSFYCAHITVEYFTLYDFSIHENILKLIVNVKATHVLIWSLLSLSCHAGVEFLQSSLCVSSPAEKQMLGAGTLWSRMWFTEGETQILHTSVAQLENWLNSCLPRARRGLCFHAVLLQLIYFHSGI